MSEDEDILEEGQSAEQYVGHTALVGITYVDQAGTILERTQVHGTVVRINEDGWLVLARPEAMGEFLIPPKLDVAKPGIYRLKSTGEEVRNPEYIVSYTVTRKGSADVP